MQYLVLAVLISVPIMLCVKPIFLAMTAPKAAPVHEENEFVAVGEEAAVQEASEKDDDFTAINKEMAHVDYFRLKDDLKLIAELHHQQHSSHAFGELFIHQMIETIEFVLGTVSNTASYLRLWALSLAHSQLAKVFFDNCLVPGLQSGDLITLFLGFFVFMTATGAVLMLMDVLECFLHCLRLHWVEFQNKFYKGQGLAFNPTSL